MALYYRFHIDTERNWTFASGYDDISVYVQSANWGFGMQGTYDYIPAPAFMSIVINNSSGDFNLSNPLARYYGKISSGMLARVQMSQDGINWLTMCVLGCKRISPMYQDNPLSGEVVLECVDILPDFLQSQYVPPLQLDVRVDEALSTLHETTKTLYPYPNYYQYLDYTSLDDGKPLFDGLDFIDFEQAETSLEFVGDNLGRGEAVTVSNFVQDMVKAEIYGLYYWSPRFEKTFFLSRYHAADTAISWYLSNLDFSKPTYQFAKHLRNDTAVSYYPRAIGDTEQVLWESDSVPLSIAGLSKRKLIVRYRDPNIESSTVGALDVIIPQPNVDFIANLEPDGSGIERTTRIRIHAKLGAASTELTIRNYAGGTVYITLLQLRGTPITTYNKEIALSTNHESILQHGTHSHSEDLRAVSSAEFAQDFADFLANVYGTARWELERLNINISDSSLSASINQVMNRTIGDVINVNDSGTQHNADYMIIGEQHSIDAQNAKHSVTYTLRPTNRGNLFILGTSGYDDGDVLAF